MVSAFAGGRNGTTVRIDGLLPVAADRTSRRGLVSGKNFEGSIGPSPVHLSLQRYDGFGSGVTVEGSYFYDAKQSPIALYGKAEGTKLTLCEIVDDKELDRVLVMGSKTPIDTTGCPLSLDISDSGATGIWAKGPEKFPVVLKQVAGLDDTAEGKINGIVEIPFGRRRLPIDLPVSSPKPTPASA